MLCRDHEQESPGVLESEREGDLGDAVPVGDAVNGGPKVPEGVEVCEGVKVTLTSEYVWVGLRLPLALGLPLSVADARRAPLGDAVPVVVLRELPEGGQPRQRVGAGTQGRAERWQPDREGGCGKAASSQEIEHARIPLPQPTHRPQADSWHCCTLSIIPLPLASGKRL